MYFMKTDYANSSHCNQYNGDLALCSAEDSDVTSVTTRAHILKIKGSPEDSKEACSIVWAVGCCITEVYRSPGFRAFTSSAPRLQHDGW